MIALARAGGESFMGGGPTNVTMLNSNTVATGAGASNTGTLRTILSTDSTLPLPTGGATSALQTSGNASLSTISSVISSTVAVSASSLPLPAGAATSALQTSGNASLSTIASVISSTVGVALVNGAYLPTVATPTISSVTVTSGASVQVMAADANRKTYSITTYPNNTDFLVCHWGAASATLTSEVIIFLNTNMTPSGAVETLALQCIANSGSQVLRAVSWAP